LIAFARSMTALVRRSKSDSEGRGEVIWLGTDTVALVCAWRERAGIAGGRLFRTVSEGDRVGGRLDPSQVPRVFKAMAPAAGGAGGAFVRPQRPRGCHAGHDRGRDRVAGDPAGGSVEVDGHG